VSPFDPIGAGRFGSGANSLQQGPALNQRWKIAPIYVLSYQSIKRQKPYPTPANVQGAAVLW